MIIDINNLPVVPDSDLDSDTAASQVFDIQPDAYDGLTSVIISLGDWVDVDEAIGLKNADWGYSFQVVGLYPSAVGILVDDGEGNYYESQLTPSSVTNVFRRVGRSV
jgi:hypothetical protein